MLYEHGLLPDASMLRDGPACGTGYQRHASTWRGEGPKRPYIDSG
ncbi:hypothetical protein OH686_13000 [Pseudomonas sp. SO81]|nr:hypothetical protein OH686_13000 [Pseudomonas sp. SO81]